MIKRPVLFLSVVAFALPLSAKILYFATTGSDTNKCTVTAPCKDFGALVPANVTVADGDTILALDSVDFTAAGTQPGIFGNITIDGGAHGAFMTGVPGGGVIPLQLNPGTLANVVVRNITVILPNSPATDGIFFSLGAGGLISFENVNVVLQGPSSATGIYGQAGGGSVRFDGVKIAGAGTGIFVQNTGFVQAQYVVDNSSFDVSGTGIALIDGAGTIRNSNFTGPSGAVGLNLGVTDLGGTYLIDTCSFQSLTYGVNIGNFIVARFSNSTFSNDGYGIYNVSGGSIVSFRNNVFAGNGADGSPALTTSLK